MGGRAAKSPSGTSALQSPATEGMLAGGASSMSSRPQARIEGVASRATIRATAARDLERLDTERRSQARDEWKGRQDGTSFDQIAAISRQIGSPDPRAQVHGAAQ